MLIEIVVTLWQKSHDLAQADHRHPVKKNGLKRFQAIPKDNSTQAFLRSDHAATTTDEVAVVVLALPDAA
ncbi:hypothetical protein [Telmatospirillum siberiense]|uniref:Uncharacterized protein n=1 Tax=Telmatospirillum siberiense TaxID=382514 RepID=A0A2N3PVE9_9PROT|nr:hypothetical protein [Telmatospirillum siberiense]PKU24375.1 hypothetical protein CWS72_12355 [Telmatospirillum siberiense]